MMGCFEERIQVSVALLGEMLWNPNRDEKAVLEAAMSPDHRIGTVDVSAILTGRQMPPSLCTCCCQVVYITPMIPGMSSAILRANRRIAPTGPS